MVLSLLLSLSAKADDIKEFEIEGMSIGESLLKFYNNVTIMDRIKNQPQYYKDNEYILLTFIALIVTLFLLWFEYRKDVRYEKQKKWLNKK